MFDLEELYQEVIIDHNRSPRNFHKMEHPDRHADGYNPLCGDKLQVFLQFDGDVITDVSFEGTGCAISVASASLMTETLKGKTEAEAEAIFEKFHTLVTDDKASTDNPDLGKLNVLAGVRAYPARVKCATLCWHTLKAALKQTQERQTQEQQTQNPASTE